MRPIVLTRHHRTPPRVDRGSPQRAALRRWLLTTLTVGVAATCCASARADFVAVVPVGGTEYGTPGTEYSQLPVQPDITNQSYTNISTAGGAPRTVTVPSGYSVPLLIGTLDPGASFTFAEVPSPDNRSVLLTEAQATSKTAFAEGPPAIWQDSAGTLHFLIPSTGTGTANEGETFATDVTTLNIYLHSGSILSVSISGPKGTVAAGKLSRFTAKVTGAPPGATLSYTWSFGDGTGGSKNPISHSYILKGTYDVYLKVAGSGDSLGFSQVTPITVGEAPKGPDRKGGGKVKKKTAPNSGASVKGSGGKNSTARNGTSTTTGASSTTKPSAAATSTTATTTTATTTPKTSVKPAASQHVAVRKVPRPAGPLLSGVALSHASVPAAKAPPVASARPGVPNPARTGHVISPGHGPGEGFWIALCTLATLIGGAALEWKGRPRIPSRARLDAARLG